MSGARTAARVLALLLPLLAGACGSTDLPELPSLDAILPVRDESVRFAVIGDSGTGGSAQYDVARRMVEERSRFPFDFVLMLGDNMYGFERPQDFRQKFERPYGPLLDAKVEFRAALGNHDDPNQRFYEPFNMGGERYYAFQKGNAKFFALDSNYLDEEQLEWLARELERSNEDWKICFFHHPLYSSGAKHGSEVDLRQRLEPLFVKNGVRVVFAGHEHFYERIRPQNGVVHFIAGASAKLRRGNIRKTELTARGVDTQHSFMLVEIAGDELHFETLTRTGARIDAGVVSATDEGAATADASPAPDARSEARRPGAVGFDANEEERR